MNKSLPLLLLLFALSVQQVSRAGTPVESRAALTAEFTHALENGNPYRIKFTNTSKEFTSSHWDFGDGSANSSETHPSHQYVRAGEYSVTLTVTGSNSPSLQVTKKITVSNDLQASFTMSATKGPAPLTVDLVSTNLWFITSRQWTITPATGFTILSGTTTSENLKIQFNTIGTYKVSLEVKDGVKTVKSEDKSISVESKTALQAAFEWNKPVIVNQPTTFINRTVYRCVDRAPAKWSFEGFYPRDGDRVEYTFTGVGKFPVVITVTDNCGNPTSTKTEMIEVVSAANAITTRFIPDKTDIRKGQTVTFYDNSTAIAPIKIGSWTWWYEQRGDLREDENPDNKSSANDFYYSYRESVQHTYNRPGTYTVRLYTSVSDAVPGDHADVKIYVRDTPEPKADYVDIALRDYNGAIKVMQYARLDKNIFAYQHRLPNPAPASSRIEVYRKGSQGQSDWSPAGYYSNKGDLNSAMSLRDFRLKDNRIMSQMQAGTAAPCSYQFLAVGSGNSAMTASSSDQIPSTLFDPILTNKPEELPTFDFFGNEAAVLQQEADKNLHLYIIKKGGTWSQSTRTKIRLGGFQSKPRKIFMDENTIILDNGTSVSIFEKAGSVWNTTPKVITLSHGGTGIKVRDIGYGGNTIIVANSPAFMQECEAHGRGVVPVATLYEKPSTGWKHGMDPTAYLYLDMETEVKETTKVCNTFINTENIVGIADNHAFVRLRLQNGGSQFDRIFVYKKLEDEWLTTKQHYKIPTGVNEMRDEFEINGTDVLHTFISNQYALDEGKAEVHTLQNYCYTKPKHIEDVFTIAGKHADVSAGYIQLGGRGGNTSTATINSGASINYYGETILKPGFRATRGSTVTFQTVKCDNLYWPE